MSEVEIIKSRADFCQRRLDKLQSDITAKVTELGKYPNLTVYVTGSYGRLEASERSDIDLFLINDDSQAGASVSQIDTILIQAALINVARENGFPDFSKDAQYLVIHSLSDILKYLGGPEDDSRNYFTARLLLLLESRPIYNRPGYEKVVSKIIERYFKDYQTHEGEFRATFLLNDLVRFWKTLCLNYEEKRNVPREDSQYQRNRAIDNLKLKFSRLITCYSMIVPICSISPPVQPDQVVDLVSRAPMDRLVRSVGPEHRRLIGEIVEHYAWFLKVSTENDLGLWLEENNNREEANRRSRLLGTLVYDLLYACSDTESLRYLVI